MRISSLDGNRQKLDGGAMFGNAPKAMWEKWLPPDSQNRIELACRCLLVETGNEVILCETGIGAFFAPELAQRYGVSTPERHVLMENLAQLGVKEEDVTQVILSHLHFDHAGGLLTRYEAGQAPHLHFPKARYLVGEEAWQRCIKPHSRDRASFIPELTQLLQNSGRLEVVTEQNKAKVLPKNSEIFISHGHTPGQMHMIFHGAKRSVMFCGDLIPGLPWVHQPITMGYDRYPELLIDEKGVVNQRAVAEKWFLFFTHDPEHAMATVALNDKGRYVPAEIVSQPKRFVL